MANQEKRVQIGVCAMRDKHGNFLPAEPIYARAEDAEAAAAEEEKMLRDVAKLLAKRMKSYMEAREAAGIKG